MEWIVVVGVAILSLVVVWILVFQKDSNRRKPSESTRNVQKARLAFYSSRAGLVAVSHDHDQSVSSVSTATDGQASDDILAAMAEPSSTRSRKRMLDSVPIDQNNTTNDISTSHVTEKKTQEFHCHVTYSPLSFQYLDPKTETPVSRPLKSLDEILSWRSFTDPFCEPIISLQGRVPNVSSHHRLMVCHDMMGGYHSDKYVQGSPSDINYHIYHWHLISSFIYFSHHLVTIPPPGWTNAAHMNGVPVLGTFITEWDDGAVRCQKLLESEATYRRVADQLVAIALYYKLEGWLVNIENNILSDNVMRLRDFLLYLTDRMHDCIANSQVIWYDSVINTGELKWQNELNKMNYLFFTACDGIFLNYTWSDLTLANSSQKAGRRRNDVFVGIDVFGRGCPGGGGYNSKEALAKIKTHNLSAALFAPGWVFETQDKEKFPQLQDKFFELLQPYCTQSYCLTNLPLATNFCRGVGRRLFISGKEVWSSPWMNLSACDPQPTSVKDCYMLGNASNLAVHDVNVTTKEAYDGSHCFQVTGSIKSDESTRLIVRLFKCQISVKSPVVASYMLKSSPLELVDISVVLHIDKSPTYLVLTSNSHPISTLQSADHKDDELNEKLVSRFNVRHSKTTNAERFRKGMGSLYYEAFCPLEGEDDERIRQLEGEAIGTDWVTRHYVLTGKHLQSYEIKEIRLVCLSGAKADDTLRQFSFQLGNIKLSDIASLKLPHVIVSNLHFRDIVWHRNSGDESKLLVSLSILWDKSPTPKARHFDLWMSTDSTSHQFIGRAYTNIFRVTRLSVLPRDHVIFTVQPMSMAQFKPALKDCSSLKLTWTQ
ncbi:cytosolic endo-beta-N-acetylglucosaminidase-like isoform X2 [Corticium candelabrum]|uniref:cytosolic endo-beta-N-acetylglucosaminidase-like isoform X2 n=1 Tax=Corticium candelabrum TaxID=121492 RepID=UPI002E265244|nr:cytosolic endo-beta-N-acetylglucosaminidase-like isoform X2 [Corticium candelabrum]